MHSGILDITARAVFVPVRHHSPACARAVRQLVRDLRPAAILIEGPSDFNDRIDELLLPHTLPIAIYSYVRLPDDTRRGAFYPFCAYSPEWIALQSAREIGAQARFIDLPWAALATVDTPAHRYADGELRASPYIATLREKLGVEDFDTLWDTLFEIDRTLPLAQLFERAHHFCYHVRACGGHVSNEDLRREAFMAEAIRHTLEQTHGRVLVVTGGFHSYALYARIHGLTPPEAAQTTIDRDADTPGVLDIIISPPAVMSGEAAAEIERGIALTPYGYRQLDSLTGYEAGMPSPGFYDHVWHDRADGRGEIYRHLLAATVADVRQRGQIASTADLIAVETCARALAALRGHAEIWRQDLIDAIIGALIKDGLADGLAHPFLDAILAVFRGSQRGALAEGTTLPPLTHDIRRLLRAHGLEPELRERTIRLDLAVDDEHERSRVLHQLRVLGVSGFTRRDGADFVGRDDLTAVWEQWSIVWTPGFDARCIEAAIYGATLLDAAAARLAEQTTSIERSAEQAALLLLDACLMGLSRQADLLFARLVQLVREDGDFFGVAAALGHLLYLYRYDHALGAAGRGDIGALLVETFQRVLWLLETLGQAQGRDQELLKAIRSLVQTFEACAADLALSREVLIEVLHRTGGDHAQHALVRGATIGALWTLHAADLEQVRADLRACAAPDRLGDFLTGLFGLARETAQRHPDFVLSIDELLMSYDDAAYLQALPALRLAFTFFTPREKHYITRTLLDALGQTTVAPLAALEVDTATATRALALEAWLLDELQRYGIRGGAR
ncbi:MAG TPA: DUF5682 family protein [Herpetosiphonaceae bacterium]